MIQLVYDISSESHLESILFDGTGGRRRISLIRENLMELNFLERGKVTSSVCAVVER
jgi:hypothetical protein